jgi:steroid 5-alpha reductase family enzyme
VSGPWIGLLAIVAVMVAVWILSVIRRDASVIDAMWGPGFALTAWLYWATSDGYPPRGLLIAVLVTVWGARLGGYILWRGWGEREDYRYRAMRESWGSRFAWVSLFTVFLLQAAILWVVSIPLWVAARSSLPAALTPLDALGVALFVVGLLFESVGDFQLARFKADPGNRGKVLDRGLWRFTRHPNYFGDAVVWWGLFLVALATPGSWWSVYSPLLMTFLLMKVSGVALLEKTLAETKPQYRDYVARTSAFFPRPPRKA